MRALIKLTLCYGFSAIAVQAHAQSQPAEGGAVSASPDDTSKGLAEIIVTAQRKSENLQKVPIAITALTASDLAASGLKQVSELSGTVPNLFIVANSASISPYLRGVGSVNGNFNAELSTAVYLDGVYLASPAAAAVFSLDNVERIEVLKGPQGTLFGRNATAGVIQVITRDPSSDPTMKVKVGYGNYDTVTASAYVGSGLAPNLNGDIAVYYEDQGDGFGRNLLNGREVNYTNNYALRSKLVFTPSSETTIKLTGDYSKTRAGSPAYQKPEGVVGIDGFPTYVGRYNVRSSIQPRLESKQYGAALRIEQSVSDLDLISISSYRDVKTAFTLDTDTGAIALADASIFGHVENYSQELQLMSNKNDIFTWVLGGFYYHSVAQNDPIQIEGIAANVLSGGRGPLVQTFAAQRTRSASAYGQGTLELMEGTHFTAGLRYTSERQRMRGSRGTLAGIFVVFPELNKGFDKFTWRLALDQDFSDNIRGYVSYNRGLKSGGFNLTNPTDVGYNPESVDAYEVGLKTELLDRRLRFNIAGFYYDYTDITVQIADGPVNRQINAGKAHIYGIDSDLLFAITDELRFTGAFGWTHGRYAVYKNAQTFTSTGARVIVPDAKGAPTQLTPEITASGAVDYRLPLGEQALLFNVSAQYTSNAYHSVDRRLKLDARTLVNASIGWTASDNRYGVKVWARNLFDEVYISRVRDSSTGDFQTIGDPRTYGVTLSANF